MNSLGALLSSSAVPAPVFHDRKDLNGTAEVRPDILAAVIRCE